MSDLIDLNSPEEKKLRSELPSPLIPSPDNESPKPSPLNISDSRKSMDNNPFDMVLRKTSEYVSKSSDPFEIVFDRATNSDNQLQNLTDFTDDLLMKKKKRYSDILKINKTLDESVLNAVQGPGTPKSLKKNSKRENDEDVPAIMVLPPSPADNLSILDQSAMNDSFRTCSDHFNMSSNLPGLSQAPGALDKSILNNSAMNDSLSTSENSSDDCFIKSLVAQRVSMCIKKGTLDAELLNVVDDKGNHGKNHKLRRSFSQGDRMGPRKFRTKRSISTVNDNNLSSCEYSVPSILFEDPLNLGFINGGRGDFSVVSDYSELSNITRLNSVNSGSLYSWKSSCDSANRGFIDTSGGGRASEGDFKDLLVRFNSLRMKSTGDEEIKEKVKEFEDDDVFLEGDGVKKSYIFSQANILAKTFEELAEESVRGSNSSGENLQSIRLPSNFHLSPSPTKVENLITSPSISRNQSFPPTSTHSKHSSNSSKKEAAAHLLRDLENVVKTESNPEIMKLLKNLEKALGVKSENNLQLLKSCRQSSNDSTSPSKIPTTSPSNSRNSPKSKNSKSPIKNPQIKEKKSPVKILNEEKSKINPQDSNETPDSDKSELMNQESENSTEDNTDPSLSNMNSIKSPKNPLKLLSDPQDSFSTQKLILDIQLALGKLLEDCKDEPAVVLDNLNKLLHSKHSPKPPPSPRKSGLPYRSLKSITPHLPEPHKTPQKSPKPPALRRRSSISNSSMKSKLNDSKEPPKDSKRRNSSDPGIELTLDKKHIDTGLKIKSTIPVVDTSKLRKKNSSLEVKKGPMKALVPLGNMQRGTPKKKVPSPLNIATSTPDPSPIVLGKKTTKAKPVASSTPDVPGKNKTSKCGIQQSPKGTMSWNISPVTPNAKGSAAGMFGDDGKGFLTPKKIEKSFKGSPIIGGLNRIKEKIIRGRRSEPVKVSPRGKSPLKENNVAVKGKPLNLNSKFRRSSSSLGGFEKENKG